MNIKNEKQSYKKAIELTDNLNTHYVAHHIDLITSELHPRYLHGAVHYPFRSYLNAKNADPEDILVIAGYMTHYIAYDPKVILELCDKTFKTFEKSSNWTLFRNYVKILIGLGQCKKALDILQRLALKRYGA